MSEWSEQAIERGLAGLHKVDCWDGGHNECRRIVQAVLGLPVVVRSADAKADSLN